MSETLPGYDNWKLQTPPHLDPHPPCANCGGEFEDHIADEEGPMCLDRDNVGQRYEPLTEQDDADAAFDAATERAERRREW